MTFAEKLTIRILLVAAQMLAPYQLREDLKKLAADVAAAPAPEKA